MPVIAEEQELHFPDDNNPNKDQPKEIMSPKEREVFEVERKKLHEKLKAMSPEEREEYREESLEDEKIVLREQRLAEIMKDMTPEEREKFLAILANKEVLSKERRKRRREKKKREQNNKEP